MLYLFLLFVVLTDKRDDICFFMKLQELLILNFAIDNNTQERFIIIDPNLVLLNH